MKEGSKIDTEQRQSSSLWVDFWGKPYLQLQTGDLKHRLLLMGKLPDKAWDALRQCLNAGGIFRVYSTPNGLRNTAYYRITQSKSWKIFRWPSWMAPDWSDKREQELLDFYGGKDTPGWQHEVAGEHGKAGSVSNGGTAI